MAAPHAEMLGVTRPKVTSAASRLKGLGVISYRRGLMTVDDRGGLEDVACECYAVVWERFEEFEGRQRLMV